MKKRRVGKLYLKLMMYDSTCAYQMKKENERRNKQAPTGVRNISLVMCSTPCKLQNKCFPMQAESSPRHQKKVGVSEEDEQAKVSV